MGNPRTAVVLDANSLSQRNLHEQFGELFEGLPSEELGGFDRAAYFKQALLSKFSDPSPESALLRHNAAIEKLKSVERRNEITQWRLRNRRSFIKGKSTSALLYTAASIIQKVLGDLDINELYRRSDFSNGASVSRKRRNASKYEKFDGGSAVTHSAYPYLKAMYESSPLLRSHFLQSQMVNNGFEFVSHNILFTVPKSESIDRCAAKEPDWNMFFQKGLGSIIRSRLKRVGIDLNDQTINQRLAQVGSRDSSLATLDLSSASDSVTEELVYQLLPADWFLHLSALRSTMCKFPDGSFHKWKLFSTMGNGFTFELESLIFYALAKSVAYHFGVRGTISIYGDDIIVPTGMANALVHLLGYCGFITNKDKSFIQGHFRESCGEHFFKGINVTPLYIKKPINNLHDLIGFINRFRRWSGRNTNGLCDPRHFEFFETLRSHVPRKQLPLISGGRDVNQSQWLCGPGSAPMRVTLKQEQHKPNQMSAYLMAMYDLDCDREPGEARKLTPTGLLLKRRSSTIKYYSEQGEMAWFPQELVPSPVEPDS